MPDIQTDAFFVRDRDLFVPGEHAGSPWGRSMLHGRLLAGLAARCIERDHGDTDFHFARLTTDLFRAPRMTAISVSTSVVRDGNRIRVVDALLASDGVEIARSTALMLRRAEQPGGNVWQTPEWSVPQPDEIAAPEYFGRGNRPAGWTPPWETRPISRGGFGSLEQKRTWLRENRNLVAGEALTPFVRVAVAADYANPFANSGDRGLEFINADITLYLHRLPTGEWLGFEVSAHGSADGVAVGECTLYDTAGRIGSSTVCAVANEHRPR